MGWLLLRTLTGKEPARKRWWQRAGELSHESGDFGGHCKLALLNALHVGRGTAWLAAAAGLPTTNCQESRLGPRDDGYGSFGDEPMPPDVASDFTCEMPLPGCSPGVADNGDPTSQQLFQSYRKTVTAAGGELIVLVPPTTKSSNFFRPCVRSRPAMLRFFREQQQALRPHQPGLFDDLPES
jgi:hypothetical protein